MIINRLSVLELWRDCRVRPDHEQELEHMAQLALLYKPNFYDPVTEITKIPWYVIAALDMREESFKHTGYLGNGDPLWKVTRHVPAGRGPFSSWKDGAIDALTMRGFNRLPPNGHWDIVTALLKTDSYNGTAYDHMGMPSPYVWALTNKQVPGKYVADHQFDPNYVDTQPGTASLFLTLKLKHNIDLNEA